MAEKTTSLTRRVVLSLALASAIVGGIVAAGAVFRDRTPASVDTGLRATTTTAATTTTTTLPPTTTTAAPIGALVQPPNVLLPPIPAESLGNGARGPEVQAYEQRLIDLKFDPGPIDGIYDQRTTYAVEAFQKLLGGQPTGRITFGDVFALAYFQYQQPLHPSAEPNRTEINVTKQVITLYENYQVRLISTTSTASGENYCYNTPRENPTEHVCEVATTPSGRFTYYLFRKGWDEGVLGALYNPFYFNKGIAVHGYNSVPTHPASHGCTRIPMHIAEYFHTLVHRGDAVYVDGGQDAVILSREPIAPSVPETPPETAPPELAPPV